METPYRAVDFKQDEVITKAHLDQLQDNFQWIYENTPRARHMSLSGSPRDVRSVIVCGRVTFPVNKKKDTAGKTVRFGKAFGSGCRPHVTTGVCVKRQPRVYCILNGPGGMGYPTNVGFDVFLNVAALNKKNDHFKSTMYVHWMAHGWRTDDMNEF